MQVYINFSKLKCTYKKAPDKRQERTWKFKMQNVILLHLLSKYFG